MQDIANEGETRNDNRDDSQPPYQVMPPLAVDERAELKADIAARGVLVPVEYDERGNILDGHHRVEICAELGITNWPRFVRTGLSEGEKRQLARGLNLHRRHLDPQQRRDLIAAELREAPEASNRKIAVGLGVDDKTVATVRADLESTAEIPQLNERKGRDGKARKIVQFVPATEAEEKGLALSAKALNERKRSEYRESSDNLARALSDATALTPGGRKFPVVYADPSWRRKAGFGNRSYENHYPTMTWAEIAALPVKDMLLPDAWVFLWIPRAHLLALHPVEIETPHGPVTVKMPLAWAIARAWGCDDYSTCFVWTKTDEDNPEDHGSGLIVWDQDEILCLFKRGRGRPMPKGADKFGSNHRERPREHSRKPEHYRQMIQRMTRGLPVLAVAADDDTLEIPPFLRRGDPACVVSRDANPRRPANAGGGA
jgi:ParB-like chromosome segregation protein Spo0J/N6-adenosine-specific RNA methylase IME4